MSDIHVLKGIMSMRSRRKVRKMYGFHFSIPGIDQVVEAAQDPELVDFISVVPDISGPELTAIKAGEIVEKEEGINYNRSASDVEILAKVRARYAELEPLVLVEYIEKYRQYLTTATAT